MFGLVVHHISCDLHHVRVARTGCGESQADVSQCLRCLRLKVASTDESAALIDGYLPSSVDRARPGGSDYLRKCGIMQKSRWAQIFEFAPYCTLLVEVVFLPATT